MGDIFWDHITDVFRETSHCTFFVTDLLSSHVHLDNLSKMHVKLAVQTLSKKVASEMNKCDNETTKATWEYITACSKFWDVFNSSTALRCKDKEKIQLLDEVAE